MDAERRALVRLTDVHADGTEGPTRMLLLDANGNVQWAREIPNRAPSMTVFDPASALFPAQACGYFSLAAASGHLYFGAGTRVGLAKLP